MKSENNIKFKPRTDLILPEYGRNIQQMVEHALTIDDRAERTRCAAAIINVMGNMFPYLRDVEGFKHKLWDHLAVMSRFKLDIDYPFDVIQEENAALKPNKMPYSPKKMHYMHYGSIIEKFIQKTGEIENQDECNTLLNSIANYMKKSLLAWNNKDITLEDKKIFDDLRELSNGKISLSSDDFKLLSSADLQPQKQNNQNNQNKQNRQNNKNNNNRKQKSRR